MRAEEETSFKQPGKEDKPESKLSKCLSKCKRFLIVALFSICDVGLLLGYLPMLYHTSAPYACNFDSTRPGKKEREREKEE